MQKLLGQSFLNASKIFSLSILTFIPPAIASFTDKEKYNFEYFFYSGLITSVCEMHNENALPYQIAKKYANQYFLNTDLKQSDLNSIHNSTLEDSPRCPLPK
tara:strand:+ start:261 stop:566 length:306 start_codon:yes stop_codon:yes gene_type:complete